MKIQHFTLVLILSGAATLGAQPSPPSPDAGEVQFDAGAVWAGPEEWRCNFNLMHLGPPTSFHAMWIGDSVGALFQISTSGPETIMVTTNGTATARIVLHTNPTLIAAFADNPNQALSASVNNLCFEVQINAGALPFQVRVD